MPMLCGACGVFGIFCCSFWLYLVKSRKKSRKPRRFMRDSPRSPMAKPNGPSREGNIGQKSSFPESNETQTNKPQSGWHYFLKLSFGIANYRLPLSPLPQSTLHFAPLFRAPCLVVGRDHNRWRCCVCGHAAAGCLAACC